MKSKRIDKVGKPKLVKIGKLKKKLWTLFSEWIRRKDCDSNGCTFCVTCMERGEKKYLHWTELQAGHFLAGRSNGIIFDERGVWPQCISCNIFKRGATEDYYPYMIRTQGQEVIDELKRLKRTPIKLEREWYEARINWYRDKLNGLEKKV